MVKLLRSMVDQLSDNMSTCYLFPQRPQLHFQPTVHWCSYCSDELLIHKTSRKSVATLDVGEFQAVEIQKKCKHCQEIYRSEELRALTPHGGIFGLT